MDGNVKKYLAEIGRKGGMKSRRSLTSEQAKDMVRVREARRAFEEFYARCFWSYDRRMKISARDVPWVAEQLKKNGNREAWLRAAKLCR